MAERRFGELRSVLQRPASDETWVALCALLHDALWEPGELEAVAIPYAAEHLARWPDALRCEAPRAWEAALLAGEPCPQLICARALCINLFMGSGFPNATHRERLDVASMRNLRELLLLPGQLDAPALCAWLGGAQHLDGLRRLRIVSEQLDDERVEVLCAAPALARLTALALSQGYHITERSAHALAASPHLANLQHLNLYCAHVRDAGALALARSPHLTGLTSLVLSANAIGPAGAQALATGLPHLTELWLGRNPLGAEGARALLSGVAPLTTLDLSACQIPADALEELAQQGAARGITGLNLSDNPEPPAKPVERMYL